MVIETLEVGGIMTVVSTLFDRLLTLESGQTIELTFDNHSDFMSKKTMLFREKKKYEQRMKNVLNFKTIFIGQKVDKKTDTYRIKLSTNGTSLDWLTSAILKTKGDEDKKLDLPVPEVEQDRINKLKNM